MSCRRTDQITMSLASLVYRLLSLGGLVSCSIKYTHFRSCKSRSPPKERCSDANDRLLLYLCNCETPLTDLNFSSATGKISCQMSGL